MGSSHPLTLFLFFYSFFFPFFFFLSPSHELSLIPPSLSTLIRRTSYSHLLATRTSQGCSEGAKMAGRSSTTTDFLWLTNGRGAWRRDFMALKCQSPTTLPANLGTEMLSTLPPSRWCPPFPMKVLKSLACISLR